MRNNLISTQKKVDEHYNGIRIYADTGMHQQIIKLVKKYIKKGSTVLDVGAGEGAFSARLFDEGYQVTALDIDEKKWKATQVEFKNLDINKPLPQSIDKVFDAVVCLEVIEHIENPWNLFREIYQMSNDDATLVLSTPNVTSFWSRLMFLRTGYFHQFMPYDLQYGHINPLTFNEIQNIADNTGWELLEIKDGGYLPIFDFSEFKIPLLLSNAFRWLFYLVSKNFKKGWCLIFVFKKKRS